MSEGYVRQSAAEIVPGEVVRAGPLNAEFNALLAAFAAGTGHSHDGTAGEGAYVAMIADVDGNNKVSVDTTNNWISVYTEVAGVSVEQFRLTDGVIRGVIHNDIDLGTSAVRFKDGWFAGTLSASNFAGTLTGNVTGNVTGNITSSGTSSFATVTVSTSITVPAPTANDHATTKSYVDDLVSAALGGVVDTRLTINANTADYALSVKQSGAGVIARFRNAADSDILSITNGLITVGGVRVTGLAAPTAGTDATTKTYVDNAVNAVSSSVTNSISPLLYLALINQGVY